MSHLSGRHVLVTGSTSATGVGGGAVQAVLEAGGTPIIHGLAWADVDDTIHRLADRGVATLGIVGDVRCPEDCERIIQEAADRFGTIHALVNNAGVGLNRPAHLAGVDDFEALFSVDVRGPWLMSRAWLKHRLDGGGCKSTDDTAAIVNVSSVHAMQTIANYALYAAAKGAVEAFTRGLAVEYGHLGVRINCVAPGLVQSDQNERMLHSINPGIRDWPGEVCRDYQALQDPIHPIDVGRVIVFLITQGAGAVTGQVITVDAGGNALLFARSFTKS